MTTRAMPLQRDEMLRRIRLARLSVTAACGAVLDELLRPGDVLPRELDRQLRECSGVAALQDEQEAVPDWSALPVAKARALDCVALRIGGDPMLWLAMADPWNDVKVRQAAKAIGVLPPLMAATSTALRRHLGEEAGGRVEIQHVGTIGSPEPIGGGVVDFVDTAIAHAREVGASDVHFECDRSGVTVKLRLDGVMANFARLDDPRRAEEVISRIKVLAQLDITERRTPQDGRFRWQAGGHGLDMRVSIMPSIHGEDAVLRLLDKAQLRAAAGSVTLDALRFGVDEAARIRDLAQLPHGMLLVTGPTGSGKTTTLYAVISEVNDGLDKIVTIEDPVEYELHGVLQIPVNERKGLTFAKGLRSILRHDPDRILVGEIRDAETAEIAIQSALTGHQVLTTVHANSIYDVTGRFRHFGLDMFGFMAALNGVVVQRLLRRLCRQCAGVRPASSREAAWLAGQGVNLTALPMAAGCDACRGSGYSGRGVIAEVHSVNDALRDLVTGGAPVSALRRHVEGLGVLTLSRQGAYLIAEGITTAEEVRRVVGWA